MIRTFERYSISALIIDTRVQMERCSPKSKNTIVEVYQGMNGWSKAGSLVRRSTLFFSSSSATCCDLEVKAGNVVAHHLRGPLLFTGPSDHISVFEQ
jgi:hypothetical protein